MKIYKFSDQTITAIMLALSKCLAEESDITDILRDFDLAEIEGKLDVVNPPRVFMSHDFINKATKN